MTRNGRSVRTIASFLGAKRLLNSRADACPLGPLPAEVTDLGGIGHEA